jgi:hypothetical protein
VPVRVREVKWVFLRLLLVEAELPTGNCICAVQLKAARARSKALTILFIHIK